MIRLVLAALLMSAASAQAASPADDSGYPITCCGSLTSASPILLTTRCAILNENGFPVVEWSGEKLPDGSISCPAHVEPPLK
jgi:hypothetical protein